MRACRQPVGEKNSQKSFFALSSEKRQIRVASSGWRCREWLSETDRGSGPHFASRNHKESYPCYRPQLIRLPSGPVRLRRR